MNIKDNDKIDVLLEKFEAFNTRLTSLENELRSGKGVLIGAAATIGFILADGLGKLKAVLGINVT